MHDGHVSAIVPFVEESNRIERITVTTHEDVDAHLAFLKSDASVRDLEEFVSAVQPNAILRRKPGLNVRVGSHFPPPGGPLIESKLLDILEDMHRNPWQMHCAEDMLMNPWQVHCAYENLHPFTDGNGRSGRVLWLYQMGGLDYLESASRSGIFGFLQAWYYQTLDNQDSRQ